MNALVKNHQRSLLLVICCCLHVLSWAQPKAGFSATPRSGCSPLIVYFSDSSSGSPVKWKWDLGNGVTSFLQNPSATYFNPGTYTVKLVVSNAGGTDSVVKTQFVTVYANPSVSFTPDKAGGCFPLPVAFTDNSTAGAGTLASWQWDFGDGTLSTEKSPVHTYSSESNALVTLRVTNSLGCAASFTSPQPITVTGGVKASFVHADPGSCPAPAMVQFNATGTGPEPLTYQWNFGDGTTAIEKNPSHTYSTNGTYAVSLKLTSPQGCVDSIRKDSLITIGSTKADFTVPTAGCINEPVVFAAASSSAPTRVSWDFGDGSFSTAANPVKMYAKAGVYTIRLIRHYGACPDTTEKQIAITTKPDASFTATQQSFCRVPATVNFSSNETGANLHFRWDFGDGTTGTGSNPTHTYTGEGSFSVRLVVTNAAGCSDSLVKKDFITVQRPNLNFKGLPQTGCVPLTVSPIASILAGQTLTKYQWNFGDGFTSSSPTPSHTYTKPGTYSVSLVVTTVGGCTDTVVFEKAVRVGEKPAAAFRNQPTVVCAYQQVAFTDESKGTVDQWLWDFGGVYSTEQHPVVAFSDTGYQNVTLIAYSNGCADTVLVQNALYVNPPASRFTVANDCENRFAKTFTDQSLGAKTWFWEFGDGQTATGQHPSHTYAGPGRYTVTLTVTNGQCTHATTRVVAVMDERARFAVSDSVLCRNTPATFGAQGITSSNIADWHWDFGDGSSRKDANATTHAYNKAGRYVVTLTVTDLLGCKSTQRLPLVVYGPTADFAPAEKAACLKDNRITFNDASTTDGYHPIRSRTWNFGDGVIDSTLATPYVHRYLAAGSYTISLSVTDNLGCRDTKTLSAPLIIAQPKAAFTASDTITCTGRNISFTNTSSGLSPAYTWYFGDGSTTTAVSPAHAYTKSGIYSIKLVAKDQYGCTDSLVKQNHIAITFPKAKLSVSDSVGTCPPFMVSFTNRSTDFTSITWDFGDGTRSKADTPSHFYTQAGTYLARLLATGPGGCTDTVFQKIVVKGPSGSLTYSPLAGCSPLRVNFTASVKNSQSLLWDFSDGNTQSTQGTTVSHTYVSAGEFVPKLIITDDAGCSVPVVGKDTVRVKNIITSFVANATAFCNDGRVTFTNQTVSNDYITGYQWQFGDGSTGMGLHPVHHYTKAGRYTVQLTATTQSGCTDTYVMTDTVTVFTSPVISIAGDTAACAPAKLSFQGVVRSGEPSGLRWNWNLANGQTSNLQQPVQQAFPADGTYTVSVIATNEHGCSDTASKTVTVYPVPTTSAGDDVWICRGAFSQLKATGATTYSWQEAASLSCTNCDSPLAIPTGTTQYVVTGTNRFGCSVTDSVTVGVHQPFTLSVGRGDTICLGETVTLSASGADLYSWAPASGVRNPAGGATTVTPTASTLYTVTGRDRSGCFTDTGSVYVKVWPIPGVTVEDAVTLPVGNSVVLKPRYSADVTTYQWSPAQTLSCATCATPVAKPKTATTYTIAVKNDGGCTARDEVSVQVVCNNGNLFIPNTFSPNTDGRNDHFYLRGNGISAVKSIKIFNRWGEVVYSRENVAINDPASGWDGSFKGKLLPPDVYIYTCDVVCLNNELLTFKGDVTLLR